MQLFGKSSKSPAEAVKLLKESLVLLERGSDGKKQEKALEEVRYFSLATPFHKKTSRLSLGKTVR